MRPIILMILDGWGIGEKTQSNAIEKAKIPNIKKIEKIYQGCSLQASGIAVGLPWNEAGNSEVGHLNMGGGRIIYQYLPKISLSIKNSSFFKNPALLKTINHVKSNNSFLHIMGLYSSGNVHSYLEHLYAILELAQREKVEKLRLHCFLDGKDAPLKEGAKIIEELQEKMKNHNWKIASIIGRFYALDRNKNWDRTQKAYNLLVNGEGEKTQNPIEKIKEFYSKDITDTYIPPITITDEDQNLIGIIKNNDGIIFFDFREDSARQLTKAFVLDDFSGFSRQKLQNIIFCTMTQYEKNLPIEIVFPPIEIKNHLTEILSKANKRILKIAETEKYAHVTYFFNGGKEEAYSNETRQLIPSRIVSYYDEIPEMQAEEITKTIIEGIKNNYDLIIVNYANTDMIGHTGNFKAAVKAAECLDKNIESIIKIAEDGECILIITSDHGNIEQMMNVRTGEKKTKHTANPVPFYLIGKEFKLKKPKTKEQIEKNYKIPSGLLSDIAPTILELLKIPQPSEMTGRSLLGILK